MSKLEWGGNWIVGNHKQLSAGGGGHKGEKDCRNKSQLICLGFESYVCQGWWGITMLSIFWAKL